MLTCSSTHTQRPRGKTVGVMMLGTTPAPVPLSSTLVWENARLESVVWDLGFAENAN
jgi:hypothetical protein